MKSLGNDYILSVAGRHLPFHHLMEGWPGTYQLGSGDKCMGFSISVLEGVDYLFPDMPARPTAQWAVSMELLAAGNQLLRVLLGLRSNGMSLQRRIPKELFKSKAPE